MLFAKVISNPRVPSLDETFAISTHGQEIFCITVALLISHLKPAI